MNDAIFFVIILMISPTQVDVIYNKVSLEDYKNQRLGVSLRKTYENTATFFNRFETDKRKIIGNNESSELFIHVMDHPDGYLQKLTNGMAKVYRISEVRAETKTDIIGTDEYVRFAHRNK